MCSIMGYCGSGASFEAFKAGFDRTISRGPDDSRIIDTGNGLLGFHRLSIMGLTPEGMQPFELDGSYAVCNGELYGFEAQKKELIQKGYRFKSGSDACPPWVCPDSTKHSPGEEIFSATEGSWATTS